jgi:hypothetical protein
MNQKNEIEQGFQNLITLAHAISASGEQAGELAELIEEEELDISDETQQRIVSALESIDITTEDFKNQLELVMKSIAKYEPRRVN